MSVKLIEIRSKVGFEEDPALTRFRGFDAALSGVQAQDGGRHVQESRGFVQVEGIVQLPKHSGFTPDNVAAKNQWYWIDTKEMGEAGKLGVVAPVVVALPPAAKGVYPAGGAVRVDIPNDHKKYAFFWFSMALAALAVYILSGLQPAVKLEEKNAGVYQP